MASSGAEGYAPSQALLSDEVIAQALNEEEAQSDASHSLAEESEVSSVGEEEEEELEEMGSGDENHAINEEKDDKKDGDGSSAPTPSPSLTIPSSSDAPAPSTAIPKKGPKKQAKKKVAPPPVGDDFIKSLEALTDEMLTAKIDEMETQEALLHEQAKEARRLNRQRMEAKAREGKPTAAEKAMAKKEEGHRIRTTYITVNYKLAGKSGSVQVQPKRGIGFLRTRVMEEAGIDKKHRKELVFNFKGEDLFDGGNRDARTTINSMKLVDGCTVEVSIRGSGGAVLKPFLKQSDALASLQKRALKVVKDSDEKIDMTMTEEQMPQSIKAYLDEKRASVASIKLMKEQSGANVIKLALANVSSDDLNSIKSIISDRSAGRKGGTEERVIRSAYLLFPALREVQGVVALFNKFECEVCQELLRVYITEYHTMVKGQAQIQNAKFIEDINYVLQKRAETQGQRENINAQMMEAQSNCSVS